MSIQEAMEAMDFPGAQGLTVYGSGRANFLCRGGSFNFRDVGELEKFLEALKRVNARAGTSVPANSKEGNVPRGTIGKPEFEQKATKGAKEFTGFNQTEANAS